MECIFCKLKESKEDIIYESENFLVKVGIGLAAPGHVMLIPKNHYIGFVYMPEELFLEYNEVKKYVYNKLKRNFSEPFMVEYCKIQQSVPHSHLHFIPKIRRKSRYYKSYFIKDLVKEIKIPRNLLNNQANIEKIREIKNKDQEYIYLEDKKSYLFTNFENYKSCNLKWRYFFNKTYKNSDILLDWTKITKKEKLIDEYKRNLTKNLF